MLLSERAGWEEQMHEQCEALKSETEQVVAHERAQVSQGLGLGLGRAVHEMAEC